MSEQRLRQYRFTITAEDAGQRLDLFLTGQAEVGRSRTQIQRFIREGTVWVNGGPAKAGQVVQAGDEIELAVPPPRRLTVEAEAIPLDVIYEDGDIIVVNKQRGLVVHPAPGHPTGTLVNALLEHCGDLAGIGGMLRPGIVHRLDKDTTGLMVAAKSDLGHQGLVTQIKARRVQRQYLALVHGAPLVESGIVDAPIGRHRVHRLMMTVAPGRGQGKPAVTRFWVQERLGRFALLRCQLETGRTHQIRVHLSFIGHAVVGDQTYAARKETLGLAGQALHAQRLSFRHPRTDETLDFSVPLPADVEQVLEQLRSEPLGPDPLELS